MVFPLILPKNSRFSTENLVYLNHIQTVFDKTTEPVALDTYSRICIIPLQKWK